MIRSSILNALLLHVRLDIFMVFFVEMLNCILHSRDLELVTHGIDKVMRVDFPEEIIVGTHVILFDQLIYLLLFHTFGVRLDFVRHKLD